ncbi:MAG: hypothetical protein KDK72_10655 [Chlamydiia bacterium]|nr:hypothetical protein [Chlamydiia bacterium]
MRLSISVFHHFDESQLFQLAGSSIDESLKGRELFGKTYVELSQMLAEGAKAKVVMIETQEDLDYMFGNDEMAAVPLFFIDQKGGLTPVTESNNFKPALGDSLLVFDRRTGL